MKIFFTKKYSRIIRFTKKHKGFLFLFVFIVFWTILLFFLSPQEIVEIIGVERGYLLIFLTALIGVSSFSSTPFYATLITLAGTGEFNPFLIGLIVGPAMVFGDSIFFLLGYKSCSAVEDFTGRRLKNFFNWLNSKPNWLVPFAAYLYTAFSPLPQDLLMFGLGVGKFSFRKIFIAVLLGNATFAVLISYLAQSAFLQFG